MKLKLSCVQCVQEKKHNENEYIMELRDDNIYSLVCKEGHESIIVLGIHRFELLFEMGVYAIRDGYYREAVSNFAASIERFHEFSIEIFMRKSLNSNEFIDEYKEAWKHLGKQSERQLGAYVMLYLATLKKTPELIKNKQIEFRNDVIHKGKFPTLDETNDYAKIVFEYIKAKIIELKKALNDEVEFVYEKNLREYIVGNDVNGKFIVNWSEPITFQTMRPLKELDALEYKLLGHDGETYKPFLN